MDNKNFVKNSKKTIGFIQEANGVIKDLKKDPDYLDVHAAIDKLEPIILSYHNTFDGRTTEGILYNQVYQIYDKLISSTNENIAKDLTRILKS